MTLTGLRRHAVLVMADSAALSSVEAIVVRTSNPAVL